MLSDTTRYAYSAAIDRPPLTLPGNARIACSPSAPVAQI